MSVSTPGSGFKGKALTRILGGDAVSGDVDIRAALRGTIRVPDGWNPADITFEAREKTNTTSSNYAPMDWAPVRDADGELVRVTNIDPDSDAWYPVPAAVFACSFIRLRSTAVASEDNVTQDEDQDLILNTKTA